MGGYFDQIIFSEDFNNFLLHTKGAAILLCWPGSLVILMFNFQMIISRLF